MTYKEIIDIFKEKTTGHFFLNEFGYGDISDISTPDDGKSPMYPYVFLNPIAVNGGEQVSTFNFNLICMTQTQDDEQSIIDAQSNCIDYLRDLISSVNYSITNPLVEFQEPFNFTPFKERFQDDVVGATVNMSVVYPTTLDLCKAPIAAPEDCLLFNTLTSVINEGDTIFNTTFEFGGWGYLNANERNDYSGYTFTFECDTTYGYYIAKEGVDFTNSQGVTSDNNYPLLIYVKNNVNPSEQGWWGTTVPSLPLSCGNEFPYTDHSGGLKIPTFNNNGWIYPTEGWAYSNRLGYNYLFSTNCNDPKPIPTAAPIPPPSPTPTPTTTTTPTPTVTPSITPTNTVTPTITPTITPTPSCFVQPTDCLTLTAGGGAGDNLVQDGAGNLWDVNGEYELISNFSEIATNTIVCTGYTSQTLWVNKNNRKVFANAVSGGFEYAFFGLLYDTGGTAKDISCGVSATNSATWSTGGQGGLFPVEGNCGYLVPISNTAGDSIVYGVCATPTPTPTNTTTPTVTPTVTSTVTPSVTSTPSITATPSITVTPTNTVTPTTTVTPTVTVTPTQTTTPTPTPSPIFYHIEAQNGDLIITQGGDFIDWFPL